MIFELIGVLFWRNSENLLTIEKSFQAGTKILYSNCVDIDSTLLPLIYYKNSMTSTNGNEGILLEIKFKKDRCVYMDNL